MPEVYSDGRLRVMHRNPSAPVGGTFKPLATNVRGN